MKRSRDIWVIVLLFVGLFVALQFVVRSERKAEDVVSSSYNADPLGTRAFYTLLGDRLGYNARRLNVGFGRLPKNAKVIVLVEPTGPWIDAPVAPGGGISSTESGELTDWVMRGGTLILASKKLANAPDDLRRTGALGKGHVYAFDSPRPFTNRGMRDGRNAVEMVGLVAAHASKSDLILFDEVHHGFSRPKTLVSMIGTPVKRAAVVFALALLIAAYSQGRRFGAVRDAPETQAMRPGSEFVEAVGRLYRRAGATDVAVDVMVDSLLHKLSAKLGVSADLAVSRLQSAAGPDMADRLDRLVAARKRALAGQKPTERELLDITREVQHIEKELGLERNRN